MDDLCVRFIINLPHEELGSVERICFQIEEAQWFYEDFIRPLDPSLPSLPLRNFSLLIFQHCPLFAGFPPEFFSQAFSQFLAYKTRVPVRGAILLNEQMDQVVLVKGWKKNANWSFPRGKINKHEKDLDCAIREVYEETGFDVRAAGLVQDEKEVKYIPVTIREQQVGLYVFRGVPMDTYFEPRTRKEISKIEWWKLSDLPTFKKNKHQEGNGEGLALNANKFYLVAPFLNDLRKWISRQRKRDAVEGKHLAARPVYEEPATATEDERDLIDIQAPEMLRTKTDLPEVSMPPPSERDPSTHLKALLHINQPLAPPPASIINSNQSPNVDQDKSNALLSLLRNGPKHEISQDSIRSYASQKQTVEAPSKAHIPRSQHMQTGSTSDASLPPWELPIPQPSYSSVNPSVMQQPASAPYQRTGDPVFARTSEIKIQRPAIPPASSLPQLSKHAQSLLDAFKVKPSSQTVPATESVKTAPTDPSLQSIEGFSAQGGRFTAGTTATPQGKRSFDNQKNLLDLFRQPSGQGPKTAQEQRITPPVPSPVELAANPAPIISQIQPPNQKDMLMQLFQRKADAAKLSGSRQSSSPATAQALLSQFTAPQKAADVSQSTATRTQAREAAMGVPQEQKRITILQRLPREELQGSLVNEPSSHNDNSQKWTESPKTFQPQILLRPTQASQPSPAPMELRTDPRKVNGSSDPISSTIRSHSFDRRTSQSDSHKQSLLSLFAKPAGTSTREPIGRRADSPASIVGPSPGPVVSPLHERPPFDPDFRITPPTRSRIGSASSFGGQLTPSSTRTTKPDERQFLLDLMTKGHAS